MAYGDTLSVTFHVKNKIISNMRYLSNTLLRFQIFIHLFVYDKQYSTVCLYKSSDYAKRVECSVWNMELLHRIIIAQITVRVGTNTINRLATNQFNM